MKNCNFSRVKIEIGDGDLLFDNKKLPDTLASLETLKPYLPYLDIETIKRFYYPEHKGYIWQTLILSEVTQAMECTH